MSCLTWSFNRPSSHVIVDTDKGLTWSTSGTSASMHGNWRYKYSLGFVKIHGHGSFDVSVSGLDFSVSATLGVDKDGRPTISSTGCSSHVGYLRIKFHGGASWLYNLFHKFVEKQIKSKLQAMMYMISAGLHPDS